MHDLSALETNETNEDTEWEGQGEGEDESEESELDEADELEAAAQLLSVGNEAELDHFLGGLIRKAAGALGRSVKAATGNSLGSLLKGVAKQALPMVAGAFGGPVGSLLAKGGIDAATKAFGLELEGMSEEDQELEVARRYVRVANATARRALRRPVSGDPRAHARSALSWAVRRHAPGLARNLYGRSAQSSNSSSAYGWRHRHRHHHAQPQQSWGYSGAANYASPPCPSCAPCPTCPECGAPAPDASAEALSHPTTGGGPEPSTAPAAEPADAHEYEDQQEYESSYEDEAFDAAAGGGGGRWVRSGNRIILYGA